MNYADFKKLSLTQQLTLYVAMHVRNEMEDFHTEHLSDAQMKALNPIIRQAVFDVLSIFVEKPKTKLAKQQAVCALSWLTMMIPDYWEVPDKTSGDLELPKDLITDILREQ